MKRIALITVLSVFTVMTTARAAETAKPEKADPKNPVVKIATSKGDILIELNAEKAPITVENFLAYTKDGFYNDTVFHRVISGFMIQGGGMTANMRPKTTKAPIKNEASNGLKNKRGTIAMARTNIPNSATSQFFINHKDNPALDFRDPSPRGIGYAVFGKVIEGMEVVDAIAAVKTTRKGPHGDVPVEPITIKSVTVAGKKACACCKTCDKQAACKKDCDKCPNKETCTKTCPKKASCCKDGKCTKEDCPCCKDGKCCGEDCKCCKTCDKKAECKKDCDKCPKKGTKDCPKEKGSCCAKKADKPAAESAQKGCGCTGKKPAKPAEKKAACCTTESKCCK